MNPYQTADKVISYLIKRYQRLFRKARTTAFDELNVIAVSHDIYDTALSETKQEMARLSRVVYERYGDREDFDGTAFVLALMLAYDPVTKYVYENEVDRKRARFVEGVLGSPSPLEEIKLAERLWVSMNKVFADEVTFQTMIQAYRDMGVKKVRWVTSEDERRCATCGAMHGKIYSIDKVPPKPHRNCRCWVEVAES
jgi:SPP1 gp7 family putative phage head morphogenesis protein